MIRNIVRYLVVPIGFCAICVGCADNNPQPTTKPMTADQRQAAILADPMHYGADASLNNKNGTGQDKPTLKDDVNNFFNP